MRGGAQHKPQYFAVPMWDLSHCSLHFCELILALKDPTTLLWFLNPLLHRNSCLFSFFRLPTVRETTGFKEPLSTTGASYCGTDHLVFKVASSHPIHFLHPIDFLHQLSV